MIETYEQKKRRLFGSQNLQSYLEELNKIVKENVDSANLLSIVDTDELLNNDLARRQMKSFRIFFDEKEQLQNLIEENVQNIGAGYFIFIKYSIDCGTLFINRLESFNFCFSFNSVLSGLITLLRKDLKEKIILDFYEESDNKYLEVEFYGE